MFSKKRTLFNGVQGALQRGLINGRKLLSQFLVDFAHDFGTGGMSLAPELRQFCAYAAAVSGVVSSFDQAISLKAIHQLGDVGTDTGELLSQFTQAERGLFCRHNRQRSELRG